MRTEYVLGGLIREEWWLGKQKAYKGPVRGTDVGCTPDGAAAGFHLGVLPQLFPAPAYGSSRWMHKDERDLQ